MLVWLLLLWFLLSVLLSIRFCVLAERCIAAVDTTPTAAAGSAEIAATCGAPRARAAAVQALVPVG